MSDPHPTIDSRRDLAALEAAGVSPDMYDRLVRGIAPGRFADCAALTRQQRAIIILCKSSDADIGSYGFRLLESHPDAQAYCQAYFAGQPHRMVADARLATYEKFVEAVICEQLHGPPLTPADLDRIEADVAAEWGAFIALDHSGEPVDDE